MYKSLIFLCTSCSALYKKTLKNLAEMMKWEWYCFIFILAHCDRDGNLATQWSTVLSNQDPVKNEVVGDEATFLGCEIELS
jgi:hypothetical protein